MPRRRKGKDDEPRIEAFVDHGFIGETFLQRFLDSSDFPLNDLPQAEGVARRPSRRRDAADVARAILNGELPAETAASTWVTQPRRWISLRLGTHAKEPILRDPAALLHEFGVAEWYGPIASAGAVWYVRPFQLTHFVPLGAAPDRTMSQVRIRWTVSAQIAERYAALRWNGFTYRPVGQEGKARETFEFSEHVRGAWEELAAHMDASWAHPDLQALVLGQLWDQYEAAPGYHWQHLRIRAEASGVALNAHSAGAKDIDVRGLQALTHRLADAVIRTTSLSDSLRSRVESALLRTLIHDWGTKSYEFALERREQGGGAPLFKGHCYFGLGSRGQDALQHVKTYKSYGESDRAIEFLLRELGERP